MVIGVSMINCTNRGKRMCQAASTNDVVMIAQSMNPRVRRRGGANA
jgi:hypothetical protein